MYKSYPQIMICNFFLFSVSNIKTAKAFHSFHNHIWQIWENSCMQS